MRRTLCLVVALAAIVVTQTAGSAPSVVARIAIPGSIQPCAAAGGGRFVWISAYAAPYLLKIDPRRNVVVGRTKIGFGSCGLGLGAGSLWIEDTNSNTVSRVSVRTGKRTAAIPVGATPYDATFAFGAAWATANGSGEVDRIDPTRNKVVKRFKLSTATGVVGAFGSVWATGLDAVLRIDPAANAVIATIPVNSAAWTAASSDAIWVTTPDRRDPHRSDHQHRRRQRPDRRAARRPRRNRRPPMGSPDPKEQDRRHRTRDEHHRANAQRR